MGTGLLAVGVAGIVGLVQRGQDAGETCAALLGCGGCGTILLLPIVYFVLNIALLVWVARDAKSRGMDSAVVWMILVMLTSVVGLIIYIFSRPQGNLVRCEHCGNQRMQARKKCPHCDNE